MNSSWWRYSARDIDTLSWLTSSIATVSIAVVVVVIGFAGTVFGGQSGGRPLFQLFAIAMMCSAAVVIHLGAQPSRARFSTGRAVTVYSLTGAALLVSALGYTDAPALLPWVDGVAEALLPVPRAPLSVELWWAPVCAALVIMVSSPFVRGRVFVSGASAVALSTGLSVTVVQLAEGMTFPVAASLAATSTVVFAIIGGSALTQTLIGDVLRWRSAQVLPPAPDEEAESVIDAIDRMTAGRFSTQVVPFLESVATARIVSDADRTRAGTLAQVIRSILVARGDQSWLAHHVAGRPVFVEDPLRLADTITIDQRAAITALIDGLFSDPQAGVFGARLDLAAAPDDAVAVAVTVGMALPEGRRTTVLAPYYLSVKSVVRRIEWRGGESLVVTFDVDGERP